MEYKSMFKIHSIAIAFAILATIIAAFPQVHFRTEYKEADQGIELLPDSPWTARAREFMDGHGLGSIYYKDGKDDPYLFQPLGSAVVGDTGRILGLSVNDTFLLTRIVLTFAVFLLIYGFVFLLSRSRFTALAAAAMIMPAQPVLSITSLLRFLTGTFPGDYWEMAEPVNPAMIYLPFFGFLILFLVFLRKRSWGWGIASAVVLGMNFYNYFYSWTYLYAFGGVLGVIYLLQKKWSEVKQILTVFGGGLIVGIPYLYNLYSATQHVNYTAVNTRFAVIYSHMPVFVGIWVTVGLVVLLFLFPKEKRDEFFFGLALLLAPFITLNQQIITGRILQEGHYHWYFHRPTAIIFTLIAILYVVHRRGWIMLRNVLAGSIIFVSFFAGFMTQYDAYFYGTKDGLKVTLEMQKYGPAVDWLNEYAEKEEVVLANNVMSHLTVVYTPLNVFYHRAALHALSATEERLRDQLFTYYRLQGVDTKEAPLVFQKERAEISTRLYGLYYRDLHESTYDIPNEKLAEILSAYQESLSIPLSRWLKDMLIKYEVNYVVWDKKANPDWQIEKYTFFTEAAVFGDLVIYRFQR